MRHRVLLGIGLAAGLGLTACGDPDENAVERQLQELDVVNETGLTDVMLTAADPNEAVNYFQRAIGKEPDNLELQRGLAISLSRAKRATESVPAWKRVTDHDDSTSADEVQYADALLRAGEWERAEEVLDGIPPTHETYRRYRLEAMVADNNKEWDRADSFYETAVGLTTTPASVMNNWGYSRLSRGDYDGAERLFIDAIRQDPKLFTAKNNLVLARGSQGNYQLPVVPMTQEERAQLLHTLGLSAVKRGDVETGKGLFRDAIETHPRYFEAAYRSLEALEKNVLN